jgi:hypothetical protein
MAKPLALAGCALIIGMTIIEPSQWSKLPAPVTSMIKAREAIIGGQLQDDAGKSIFDLNTAKNRMKFLLGNTLTSKVMYMEVSSFDVPPVREQIMTYENSFVSGRIGSPVADGFVAILAILGGWALLRRFNAESLFVYSLLITSGIFLLIMIPLAWQRYFLIMQIPYALLAGAGVNQIWIWSRKPTEQPIN